MVQDNILSKVIDNVKVPLVAQYAGSVCKYQEKMGKDTQKANCNPFQKDWI